MKSMNSKKVYYITRSFPGVLETGGGANARKATVDFLKDEGFDIEVISPSYDGKTEVVEYNYPIHKIGFKFNKSIDLLKEYIGVKEDYLDNWAREAINYLSNKIKEDDILLCTSGGELATFKIGSTLKNNHKVKFLANYRDPINFVEYNGVSLKRRFPHVNRNRLEKKYIKNADIVLTSSHTLMDSLKAKYPKLRIENNYFGYLKTVGIQDKPLGNDCVNIVYGGTFGVAQKPEILIDVFKDVELKGVKLTFIGKNEKIKKKYEGIPNISFLPSMSYLEYCNYLIEKADVGFTSLGQDFYGNCIPSKIYEYINIGLPIFGMLPKGEAMELINKNEYGICCQFNDKREVINTLKKFSEKENVIRFKEKVIAERERWSMEKNIKELIEILKKL